MMPLIISLCYIGWSYLLCCGHARKREIGANNFTWCPANGKYGSACLPSFSNNDNICHTEFLHTLVSTMEQYITKRTMLFRIISGLGRISSWHFLSIFCRLRVSDLSNVLLYWVVLEAGPLKVWTVCPCCVEFCRGSINCICIYHHLTTFRLHI